VLQQGPNVVMVVPAAQRENYSLVNCLKMFTNEGNGMKKHKTLEDILKGMEEINSDPELKEQFKRKQEAHRILCEFVYCNGDLLC
jgi:type II secretory pathway predicted ATPase ExeA